MTVTIWPHGWSFQTFLLGLAVFTLAAICGCLVGAYEYQTGYEDAKAVYGPHAHPHPNTADSLHRKVSPR